jgi:hypothetical protein
MRKMIVLLFVLSVVLAAKAQTEGDALLNLIGTKIDAPAAQQLLKEYGITNTTANKYSTDKNGIEMETRHDTIVMMTLYKSNYVYGQFTHKLPKGINFGSSSDKIFKILGKPSTSYMNSGYAEYEYGGRTLVCWFENKALNQVILTETRQ